MVNNPLEGVYVKCAPTSDLIIIEVDGVEGTAYADEIFEISFKIGPDYPVTAPEVCMFTDTTCTVSYKVTDEYDTRCWCCCSIYLCFFSD